MVNYKRIRGIFIEIMKKFLSKYIAPILWRYGKHSRRYEIYEYLKEQQWKSLEENIGVQKDKLYKILDYSIKNIPYYKRTALENNITVNSETVFNDIKKFPILTKEIIRKEFENLYNHSQKGKLIRNTTGGTTGQPIEFLQDKNFKDWASATKMLFSNWCGLEDGELAVMLWGSERDILERTKKINDYLIEYLMNDTILNSFNMSKASMDQYIKFILEKKPGLLIAYVQAAAELARYMNEKGAKLSFNLNVMTSAGTLFDYQRNLIEKQFGGEVFNKYGSREASDIACECEKHEGMHINILTHYLEILDDNLEEVKQENEIGEVYVTNLENYTMPMIRYRIGDSAKITNKKCSCGRGLPLIKTIIGRNIEGIRNANGKFIPAEFFIHFIGVVFNKGYIDRFQVIQDSLNQITIRVKINSTELFEQFKPEIEKNIKKVFETELNVVWKIEKKIEDPSSGKFNYVVSDVNSN